MIFLRKIIKKLLPILLIFMCSSSNFIAAQILFDIGNRQVIHQTTVNEEYSGLAYSSINKVFLMPLDMAIGGVHVKGYNLNSNQLFNVGIHGLNNVDLEGITYLKDGFN